MSLIKANAVQIGQSGTATQNFTLAVPSSPDGTIKLARGNSGATWQDVMNVSNAGVVSFPQGLGNISNSTAIATGSTTARLLANRFADFVSPLVMVLLMIWQQSNWHWKAEGQLMVTEGHMPSLAVALPHLLLDYKMLILFNYHQQLQALLQSTS